jgi:anti-anti-sigma factor
MTLPRTRQPSLEAVPEVDAVVLPSQALPTVSLVVRPHIPSAWIRLAGDLDMATEHALTEAAHRLRALTLRLIVIDLTAVTFVCSTLANFLCTVHRVHPDSELVLHRPSPLTAVMVTVAGLDGIVLVTGVTSAAGNPRVPSERRRPGVPLGSRASMGP